jgi:hypothetical protein
MQILGCEFMQDLVQSQGTIVDEPTLNKRRLHRGDDYVGYWRES